MRGAASQFIGGAAISGQVQVSREAPSSNRGSGTCHVQCGKDFDTGAERRKAVDGLSGSETRGQRGGLDSE
jgi:hypothetical protein